MVMEEIYYWDREVRQVRDEKEKTRMADVESVRV
jgi:hypothetical protein